VPSRGIPLVKRGVLQANHGSWFYCEARRPSCLSHLRGRGDVLRSKSGAPSAGSQDNDDVREAPPDVSQHRRTTKDRRRRHQTLADPPYRSAAGKQGCALKKSVQFETRVTAADR
jgi:hypothetical protein